MNRLFTLFTVLVLAVGSSIALAGTTVITFDEETIAGSLVSFKHGTVVKDQYAAVGVRVSVDNLSSGPDLGVLYDTSPGTGGNKNNDRDSDLTGPNWGNSNIAGANNYSAGNALIIQENGNGCSDGVCNRPDDQVGRRGDGLSGIITFDLDFEISSLGFDLIDFQSDLSTPEVSGSQVILSNAMDSVAYNFSDFLSAPNNSLFGENSINRVVLNSLGLSGINQVKFKIFGTGAIDTLRLGETPLTQVSEPVSLALFGLALFGLFRVTRKY